MAAPNKPKIGMKIINNIICEIDPMKLFIDAYLI